MPVIAIVTGSRDWTDEAAIQLAVDTLPPGSVVYEGGAVGADMLARVAARRRRLEVVTFDAQWKRYGRSAGPRRNREMRDAAKARADREAMPVVCLAFPLPQSVGTLDMIALCEAEGWEVRR